MWLRQSEALARSLNLPLWWVLFELGQAVEYAGDLARAVPLYESALAVARELNDAHATSVALWALSEVAYGRGDLEAAGRLNEETIALLRAVGNEFMLSMCLLTNGELALGRGDLPCAVVAYQEALELALGVDMPWAIAGALAGLCRRPCGARPPCRRRRIAWRRRDHPGGQPPGSLRELLPSRPNNPDRTRRTR